jgi:hypothetical protein
MRDDETIQTNAKNLFLGCAPERKADLDELWQDYSPKFQLTKTAEFGDEYRRWRAVTPHFIPKLFAPE